MVPLSPDELVSSRLRSLRQRVIEDFDTAPLQSQGFALFTLQESRYGFDSPPYLPAGGYGGVPEAAYHGFMAATQEQDNAHQRFEAAWSRLKDRPRDRLIEEFRVDDIGVMGLSLGLLVTGSHREKETFLDLCGPARSTDWTGRARELAYELLKPEGRLRSLPELDFTDGLPLELVLREKWPALFAGSPAIGSAKRQAVVEELITSKILLPGQVEKAAVQLRGLELLVAGLAREAVPSIETTVRLLKSTKTSFARWVWEERPQRKSVPPARWLIDRETHVQAVLWAILRPVFGPDLIDEEYLPSYGLKQARADFGILSLKLLIEVKYLRQRRDLKKTEEEIAGDLGLYFQAPERFDRLIVYVYDDRDEPEPEKYDLLRQALIGRDDRVVDVIFVQRPRSIPNRSSRGRS